MGQQRIVKNHRSFVGFPFGLTGVDMLVSMNSCKYGFVDLNLYLKSVSKYIQNPLISEYLCKRGGIFVPMVV